MSSARFAFLKPREMFRTIVLTGFAALAGRHDDRACAAGARADRQYLFRSRAASARQYSAWQSAAAARRRRGGAGTAAGPAVADAQSSAAAGAGRAAAGSGAVAAAGAAARHHRRSAECAAGSPRRRRRNQGVAVAPPGANRCRRGQRQPKGVPQSPPTLQPGDEVVTEPPAQKIVNKKASFSGLDKITGRIINFDEDIGETVQFGALRVKTDACYTRPATEAANTDAFVEVDEITLQGEVKRIFSGWMFAASPGLHGVEHPIYDIWLTDCKGPDTTVVSAQPDPPKPAPPPPPPARSAPPPKQAAPRPPPPPQQQQQQPPPPPPPRRSNPAVCSADCSGSRAFRRWATPRQPRSAMIASASRAAERDDRPAACGNPRSPLIALSSSAR